MEESEKPFACPSPGCHMSFTNEDHLVVHRKKHDMILHFGCSKAGIFIADQTPTPTRFIRNCEEMGLFQDLQTVNPFDETFRRAVESGKDGPDPQLHPPDDSLHTPQVYLDMNSDQSSGSRKLAVDTPDSPIAITTNVTTAIKKTTETVVIHEAESPVTPVIPATSSSTSISEEVQFLLKMDDGKLMPLSAIPVCASNGVPSIISQVLRPIEMVVTSNDPTKDPNSAESEKMKLSLAKKKLRQVLEKNLPPTGLEKTDKYETSEKSKSSGKSTPKKSQDNRMKRDIQERNRASSVRARAKRKMWIQQLEKSLKGVNEANRKLDAEVKSLRGEVAKLKTLLLAHKNCPVTMAMLRGEPIMDKSPNHLVTHHITSNDLVVETHTLPVNVLASPGSPLPVALLKRKAPQDFPKNPGRSPGVSRKGMILLPRPEDSNLQICLAKVIGKSAVPVTVVDLPQVQPEIPKVIVLQKSTGTIQTIGAGQNLEVDQSLQMVNAASKSTGS